MQEADVGVLLQAALLLILKLCGPPLAVGMAVGLVVSLLQAVTQVHEATVAFVPKVLAIGITLTLVGGFMLTQLTDFTHLVFDRIVAVGG
jgi:flagellar biosynthetic protein FliQ